MMRDGWRLNTLHYCRLPALVRQPRDGDGWRVVRLSLDSCPGIGEPIRFRHQAPNTIAACCHQQVSLLLTYRINGYRSPQKR